MKETGKILIYKGREYASDKLKADTLTIEYTTVSGDKSDKLSMRSVQQL